MADKINKDEELEREEPTVDDDGPVNSAEDAGIEEKEENPVQETGDHHQPYKVDVRPNRKERNRQRAEQRTRELIEESNQKLMQSLQQMLANQRIPQMQMPVEQAAQKDDGYEAQYSEIEERKVELIQVATNATDADTRDKAIKKWQALDRKQKELAAENVLKRHRLTSQPQQQNSVVAYKQQVLKSEFPSLFENEDAIQAAVGRYHELAAYNRRNGLPEPSLDDERRICQEVGEKFKVVRPRAAKPSAAQQARFAAVPSRPSPGGGNGTWIPTQQEIQLATMMYPNLPKPQALKKWWDEVGKDTYE